MQDSGNIYWVVGAAFQLRFVSQIIYRGWKAAPTIQYYKAYVFFAGMTLIEIGATQPSGKAQEI